VEEVNAAALQTRRRRVEARRSRERGFIAEWTITIICCCSAPLRCAAFVIPTGSMEDTLLIGDHLL